MAIIWPMRLFVNDYRNYKVLEKRCEELQAKLDAVQAKLEGRLDKLEKIERISANVARERANRPRNWTQFRAIAEGAEPNAHRQQG